MALTNFKYMTVDATASAGPHTITLGFTTTVGRLIVVAVAALRADRTVTASGAVASYTEFRHAPGSPDAFAELMAGICTGAVSSIDITYSGVIATPTNVFIYEFDEVTDPMNQSGSTVTMTNTGTVTDHFMDAVTPDTTETVFIGLTVTAGGAGTWTPDADFTNPGTDPDDGTQTLAICLYRVQSGSSTAQDFDNVSTTARASVGILVGFEGQAVGGGGGSTQNLFYRRRR